MAEVALLIEDAVVGQPALVVDAQDATVAAQRRSVEETPVNAVHEAHEREVLARRGHALERVQVVVGEVVLREQVLGRVAGEHELGQQRELRALAGRARDGGRDERRVAVDVADDRVDLREREAHLRDPQAGTDGTDTLARVPLAARHLPQAAAKTRRDGLGADAPA
jgi:hypothetical protein